MSSLHQLLDDLRKHADQPDQEISWSLEQQFKNLGIFGNIYVIPDMLHSDNIRDTIFKIENMLDLHNELPAPDQLLSIYMDLWEAINVEPDKIPDEYKVQVLVSKLGCPPSMAEKLCNYHYDGYRDLTIDRLKKRPEVNDEITTKLAALRVHHQYFHRFFDRQGFVIRIFTGDLNLQDLTLMSAEGGILFLEDAFGLTPTNDRDDFLANYNEKYYTRHCEDTHYEWECARKAGQYADIEMIDEKYSEYLLEVLIGAISGGHFDLVKKYSHLHSEDDEHTVTDFMDLLVETATHNRLDMYHYLTDEFYIVRADGNSARRILFAAAHSGSFEFFEFFFPIVDMAQVCRREITQSAVLGGNRGIIELLDKELRINAEMAVYTAAGTGDLEIMRRYLPKLDSDDRATVGSAYGKAKTVEVCQTLYDAGIQPFDGSIYNFIGNINPNLEVFKFLLDNFGVDSFYSHPNIADKRRVYFKNRDTRNGFRLLCQKAIQSEDQQIVEMVLDHPRLARYDPCDEMWYIISCGDPLMVGADLDQVTVTTAAFLPTVAHMLIARGLKIDPDQYTGTKSLLGPHMRNFIHWYAKNVR